MLQAIIGAGVVLAAVLLREEIVAFLTFVADHRLHGLYTLVLTTGLRRSEILGLHWAHVDLEKGHLAVVQALVEVNHGPKLKPVPKTEHSRRRLAIDAETIRVLREHRRAQLEERLRQGNAYRNTGLVFTREDGTPYARPGCHGRSLG